MVLTLQMYKTLLELGPGFCSMGCTGTAGLIRSPVLAKGAAEMAWKPDSVLHNTGDVTPDAGTVEGKEAFPGELARAQDARNLHT